MITKYDDLVEELLELRLAPDARRLVERACIAIDDLATEADRLELQLRKLRQEKFIPEQPAPDITTAAQSLGRRGGLVGGHARAAKLSSSRRREIAIRAAQARWGAETTR